MDGIGSLMQSAAPQNAEQSMPQQPTAMPNDPRMSAAMDLVTDELDVLNLDPRTKRMLKLQEAVDLTEAAGRALSMAEQPNGNSIVEQRTQQSMQGIGNLVQRLSPGIQQQGQQMAMAQRRPPMQGQRPPMQGQRPPMPQQGVSGMPARNMQGMARGGVVGYAGPDGSQVQSQAPQRPIAGQQSAAVPDQATLIAQFLAAYGALQADLKVAKPQEKDLFRQRVQDLINTTPPSVVNAAFGQGMARGGVVGYAGPDGSEVEGVTPEMQRTMDAIALETQNVEEAPLTAEEQMAASMARLEEKRGRAAEPDGTRKANTERFNLKLKLLEEGYTPRQIEEIFSSSRLIPPEFLRPKAQEDVGGIAGLLAKAGQKESPFRTQGVEEVEEVTSKITEYDPTGTESTGLPFGASQDTFVTPTAAPEQTEFEKQVEKQLLAGMNTKVEEGATARGARAKELMGLEGLMAERKALQGEARGLREERFSPERMKKRTLRAGLAGLAEKGLGGFGSGSTAEGDLIDSERAAAAGASLEEMNSLITELRAMGMTQFDAENTARNQLDERRQTALTAGSTRVNTQETNRNAMARAQMQANTQTEVANIQGATSRAVAAAQASNSEFGQSLRIKIQELLQNEPNLTQQERESRALQSLFDQDVRVQLSRLGVTQSDQQRKEITDSINSAIKILEGDLTLMNDPVRRQTRIMEVAKEIQRSYGPEGNTLPTITSQAAYDALTPGAYFIENGVQMQKPLP